MQESTQGNERFNFVKKSELSNRDEIEFSFFYGNGGYMKDILQHHDVQAACRYALI